ncbi:single-stranded DNA-binding protein [Candidatus Omnitrophota bacterium]
MANLNKAFLMGNLTRDPELRYIPSGKAVTTFTVAVNRVYSTQSGEKKEIVSFIRIVVWGRRAEVCGEYLSKGSPVFVEGRLQSRSWEGKDGQKRSTLEVIADNVQFLRMPSRQQGAAASGAPASQAADFSPNEITSINLEEQNLPPQEEGGQDLKASRQPDRQGLSEEAPF